MAALRLLLAVCVLALCAVAGRTAPPEMADFWQTIQAHKHLQEDIELAPLHLGIQVRGRVATLWGPVPSLEMSVRAERRLRSMIQLIDVRNELIVMPDDDPREIIVPERPRPLFLPEKNPPPLREARPNI